MKKSAIISFALLITALLAGAVQATPTFMSCTGTVSEIDRATCTSDATTGDLIDATNVVVDSFNMQTVPPAPLATFGVLIDITGGTEGFTEGGFVQLIVTTDFFGNVISVTPDSSTIVEDNPIYLVGETNPDFYVTSSPFALMSPGTNLNIVVLTLLLQEGNPILVQQQQQDKKKEEVVNKPDIVLNRDPPTDPVGQPVVLSGTSATTTYKSSPTTKPVTASTAGEKQPVIKIPIIDDKGLGAKGDSQVSVKIQDTNPNAPGGPTTTTVVEQTVTVKDKDKDITVTNTGDSIEIPKGHVVTVTITIISVNPSNPGSFTTPGTTEIDGKQRGIVETPVDAMQCQNPAYAGCGFKANGQPAGTIRVCHDRTCKSNSDCNLAASSVQHYFPTKKIGVITSTCGSSQGCPKGNDIFNQSC